MVIHEVPYLDSLLFLICRDDLSNVSKLLDDMFADDTNLFFSHHDIKTLFITVNNELSKIMQWSIANKLSLNAKKTKYTFFHKNSVKDNILLKLLFLQIANKTIERTFLIKFLEVMLVENITWKDHIYTIKKKLAKKILICSIAQNSY